MKFLEIVFLSFYKNIETIKFGFSPSSLKLEKGLYVILKKKYLHFEFCFQTEVIRLIIFIFFICIVKFSLIEFSWGIALFYFVGYRCCIYILLHSLHSLVAICGDYIFRKDVFQMFEGILVNLGVILHCTILLQYLSLFLDTMIGL